jgi:hypothetical protein
VNRKQVAGPPRQVRFTRRKVRTLADHGLEERDRVVGHQLVVVGLLPAETGPSRCRLETGVEQQPPHSARRDAEAELLELAGDPRAPSAQLTDRR